MDDRAKLGKAGEDHAERFLRRLGYRIVTRNYRSATGEIDLVALDAHVIVFVEVKTRVGRVHADPQDAVTPHKQRHIARTAQCFLQQTGSQGRACRFDVVAITVDEQNAMHVEHLPGAFTVDP